MLTDKASSDFISAFPGARSFLILLPPHPSFDQVAASLAFALTLQSEKKQYHIASENPLGSQFQVLEGFESVGQSVGNHSLQISFDYTEDSVENVSYNIDQDNKKFQLVIRPKKGVAGIDPATVEYAHVGIDADMIVMVGISGFEQINDFYEGEENAFTRAHTVSVSSRETTFAQTNISTSDYKSICEWMFATLLALQVRVSSEVATNLLAGIEHNSNGFRANTVTAETFETVAQLMRLGGHRLVNSNTNPTDSSGDESESSHLARAFAMTNEPKQVHKIVEGPSSLRPSLPAR